MFPIFKSSLCKGAFDGLFWGHQSLLNRYVSPTEVRLLQRITDALGGNRERRGTEAVRLFQSIVGGAAVSGRDADVIAQAQVPQQRTRGKPFLDACTSQNTSQIGIIEDEILKRLSNDYAMVVDGRNSAAHEVTPRQLASFINVLDDGSGDKQFYAGLFDLVFHFLYTDIQKQPEHIQSQILTNSGSGDTLFSLDSDTTNIEDGEEGKL